MDDIRVWLPPLNTALIVISGAAVAVGYAAIRRRDIPRHRTAMLTAAAFAALFLVVYVVRWTLFGSQPFEGAGVVRAFYLFVLATHIVLATALAPMALVTLRYGLQDRRTPHRKIARRTLPVWLYVAVSGWTVYWLLYHR
jgi:putative membrane protein